MNRFTVEETNLLSIYHEGSKAQLTPPYSGWVSASFFQELNPVLLPLL